MKNLFLDKWFCLPSLASSYCGRRSTGVGMYCRDHYRDRYKLDAKMEKLEKFKNQKKEGKKKEEKKEK
jgi:hypothetical protein